jgi:hypothetical protein
MTIKIPQMTKGKGYITYKKTKSEKPVTYGDPFKSDCIGTWETTADLNEWGYDKFKFPAPVRGKKN